MPEKIDFVLYDTWQPSTTAGAEATLFQTPQGGDSTHVESFTNMLGAGSLPGDLSFTINEIEIQPVQDIALADIQKLFKESFLEIRVSGKDFIKAPLQLFASKSGFSGHYSQTAAADGSAISLLAGRVTLKNPIVVPGGAPFKVRAVLGTALSAAKNVKVCLIGELERP